MSFEANGDRAAFQLRFRSLVDKANEFTCPCGAEGHVVMDEMSERARSSYLFARAMVGLIACSQVVTREVDEGPQGGRKVSLACVVEVRRPDAG